MSTCVDELRFPGGRSATAVFNRRCVSGVKKALASKKNHLHDAARRGNGVCAGISVGPSHVVDGQGVFATQPFERHASIFIGLGVAVDADSQTEKEELYSFDVDDHPTLAYFCSEHNSNYIRFVNSACGLAGKTANVMIVWEEVSAQSQLLVVYAKRRIKSGEELLADYNIPPKFRRCRGIRPAQRRRRSSTRHAVQRRPTRDMRSSSSRRHR